MWSCICVIVKIDDLKIPKALGYFFFLSNSVNDPNT